MEKGPHNFSPGKKTPLWKKLVSWVIAIGLVAGVYYAYTTGELLNLLNLVVEQDPFVLTVASVVGLLALALLMRM